MPLSYKIEIVVKKNAALCPLIIIYALKFRNTPLCFLFCSNESSFVSDTSMIFMMKCLHELLQVPIDDINKQLRLFLEP